MILKELFENLTNFQIRKVHETNDSLSLTSYKLLHKGQTDFSRDCLYLGNLSDLSPRLVYDMPLLCLEDVPYTDLEENLFLHLYLLPSKTDLFRLINEVADIYAQEQIFLHAVTQVQDALHKNNGLQYLIDVASEYFDNPILVNDTAYKMLGMSFGTAFKNETIEAQKTLGYIHEENVNDMKKARINELVSQTENVISISREHTMEEWLFKSIRVHDILIAFIASVNNNRPFTPYDIKFLDLFANILAIEIERNPFYSENAGVMYNYFLADLLTGKITNKQMLLNRSHYLNWKMYKYFQIVTLVSKKESFLKGNYQWLGQEIRRLVPDCHWTSFEDSFTIVISRPKAEILTPREKELLLQFFENNNLIAGQSMPFTEPQHSVSYYEQAARTSSTALFFHMDSGIYSYDEMLPYYISKLLLENNPVENYAHPGVSILKEYDSRHGTQLLETLHQYLLSGGDSAATSKKMHFHRNTLTYRLNKICELTGINLDDGNERLMIQLYLKLLECTERIG